MLHRRSITLPRDVSRTDQQPTDPVFVPWSLPTHLNMGYVAASSEIVETLEELSSRTAPAKIFLASDRLLMEARLR